MRSRAIVLPLFAAAVASCSGDNFGVYIPDHEGAEGGEGELGGFGGIGDEARPAGGEGGRGPRAGAPGLSEPEIDEGGTAGEQGASLEVLSSTPRDAASKVERDSVVQVSFSGDLDPDSLNTDSFSVVGVNGPLAGQVSVDGATATFTPASPWSLLADYTVTLAETIRSRQGERLASSHSFSFRSRDGSFRQPQRLTTAKVVNLQVVGSRAGHVAVVWNDGLTPASTFATMFDPRSAKWSKVTPLESDAQNDYAFASLGFNDRGEAFAVVGTQIGAWNRFDGATWGVAMTSGLKETRTCALANDGTAMTVWNAYVGEERRVFAQQQSSRKEWSTAETLAFGASMSFGGVRRYGAGFIAYYLSEDDKAFYSRVYDAQHSWLDATPVTDVDTSYGFAAGGDGAPLFIWSDGDVATASLYDGTAWQSHPLGPLYGAVYGSTGRNGHLAIWRDHETFYGSRYNSKSGWEPGVTLGTTDKAEAIAPGEVDENGNAFVAWAEGSDVVTRRAAHDAGEWIEGPQIVNQDTYQVLMTIDATSGEVMLVWTNALGIWASRFE